MKRTLSLLIAGVFLVSCGVDGAPTRPTITGFTKVGIATSEGLITDTDVSVVFSSN